MSAIEFYFDCSSPWTYLAITRIGDVARRTGATLDWKPILVGGIFNQVNKQVYENRANQSHPKMRHMRKDLLDWANYYGVQINWPTIFPINSVKGMRAGIYAADQGKAEAFAIALCAAYWGDNRDISQDDEVVKVAESVGLDGAAALAAANDPAIKERLKDNTQQVIDRGGFGSPTIFVNGTDMFFGNDRLELVEWAINGRKPAAG
ncbi:MAG: 2-hydroxychromene-2-carboxylate isomerase [Pseudomonadota bacterium]|nr:2-hydroxychromene-2-carboxylate isomerase [Pseudomonadota bacterium]